MKMLMPPPRGFLLPAMVVPFRYDVPALYSPPPRQLAPVHVLLCILPATVVMYERMNGNCEVWSSTPMPPPLSAASL